MTFENLWPGGYYEGDPLDPKSASSYGDKSYISILHATYLRCIKPYILPWKNGIEIGAGRGAWTKCMLGLHELYVLEVLHPDETKLFEYVGHPINLYYHKLNDLSLTGIPDNHFDFMFSFGRMCHLPFGMLQEYAINLLPKMRSGSDCFWMISDYRKAGLPPDIDEDPRPGRWYDNGLYRTVQMLRDVGYSVSKTCEDVGTCPRDPIIHFRRL